MFNVTLVIESKDWKQSTEEKLNKKCACISWNSL